MGLAASVVVGSPAPVKTAAPSSLAARLVTAAVCTPSMVVRRVSGSAASYIQHRCDLWVDSQGCEPSRLSVTWRHLPLGDGLSRVSFCHRTRQCTHRCVQQCVLGHAGAAGRLGCLIGPSILL